MARPPTAMITRKNAAKAALAEVDANGLDGFGLGRVATRLGVKAPSFYYHFHNKDELLAETARLLSAFGVQVLAMDVRRTDKPDWVGELHGPEALDTLLPRADFVILTVPHTPATEGFFNATKFRLMKSAAFFINIGRGMTTKLDDLVAALNAGQIAGAALDVFEQEPLPAEHPLWGMPNVLLTPHMAGYGPHLNERRFQIIQDNCKAFAEGRPLRNVVDKAAWF